MSEPNEELGRRLDEDYMSGELRDLGIELEDPWVSGSIMIDPNDAGATAVHDWMIMRKTGNIPDDVAERQLGVYNQMVHRNTEGPDPLVPEP